MKFSHLVARIEQLRPASSPSDIAQLSLLVFHLCEDPQSLGNDSQLTASLREMSLKLQVTTDQHAAVIEELRELSKSDPKSFDREQVFTLIRAINVQDQLLQMLSGLQPLDA